jgi:hypothetical protein
VESLGLAYIWQHETETNTNQVCKIIKERCCSIVRQNVFPNRGTDFFVFYCVMKQKCGKDSYNDECERMGIAWLKTWIWKLRELKRRCENGRCSLSGGGKC